MIKSGEISDVSLNNGVVTSIGIELGKSFTNPGAVEEKEVSSKAIPANMELKKTQDINGFEGVCRKKYHAVAISASFPNFHNHFCAFYAI